MLDANADVNAIVIIGRRRDAARGVTLRTGRAGSKG